jgi:hypothetical protein
MPDDDLPALPWLGGASPTTPAAQEATGIGLGAGQAPAPVLPSPQLDATLGEFLSPEGSLRRAVYQLGLDEAVRLLAHEYGKQAIKNSLAKARLPRRHEGYFIIRHALALFCEHFGVQGEWPVAGELAPFFPSSRIDKLGEERRDSIRHALT